MSKSKYKSDLLKTKAIPVMVKISEPFKKRVERYEELNNKTCDSTEKEEKVIYENFILEEINHYKKDSKIWILTNGPTGAGKKEITEDEKQIVEVA